MNNISKIQTVLNILLVSAVAQNVYVRNKWTKTMLEREKWRERREEEREMNRNIFIANGGKIRKTKNGEIWESE